LICATIYLSQRKTEIFLKYYKKAEYIFHPPSRDSGWQEKPEFCNYKLILSILKASHLAKEGNLTESIEILRNLLDKAMILKNGTVLFRKANWGLGTLYNQYKERKKAINCFINGLILCDKAGEFQKALRKLEDEDFFLIYYVYFKYKTAKLLKIKGKFGEAIVFAKGAKGNINDITKKLEINSRKNIFVQEFMNILSFIDKKIAIITDEITKKREILVIKKTDTSKNQNFKKGSNKFEDYLISIKQRILNPEKTFEKTEKKLEKNELLKKLQRNRDKDSENPQENEYLLKNIYKSRPLSLKVDEKFLKSLSINQSKEIEKTYLFSKNIPKTSRTNTHRTFSSNFMIQNEKNLSKSKIYEILPRPSFETIRKSRESSQDIKKLAIEDPVSNRREKEDQKIKNLLKKIVHLAENQEKKGYFLKPSAPMPSLVNIIEEKSSGFLTEKNFPIEKAQKNVKKSIDLNKETRELLKQDAIISIQNKPNYMKKKPGNTENLNIEEEYKKIVSAEPSFFQKSRLSGKKELPMNNFLKQTSEKDLVSANSSIRKMNQISFHRKDSSEEEKKSIVSGIQLNNNFLINLKRKNEDFESEETLVTQEQRTKQIKAKNIILSRFRKYKQRKNLESSRKELAILMNSSQDIGIIEEIPNINTNKYPKSASIRKTETFLRKTYTSIIDENQLIFARRIANIVKNIEPEMPIGMKSSSNSNLSNSRYQNISGNGPQLELPKNSSNVKGIRRYLSNFAQQIKEMKAFQKLENIPRPNFFMMRFIQGQLFKFKVRIKKFLEKGILLKLTSQQGLNFDLTIPLKEERKSVSFLEYKTIWPIVFEALFSHLKERKLVKEEEFYSELDGLLKPIPMKMLGFLENPSFLRNNKITPLDIENIGQIKMLIDVLFDKSLEIIRKPVGLTIKDAFSGSIVTTKALLLRRLGTKKLSLRKLNRTKRMKDSRKINSFIEELKIQELRIEIGDLDKLYKDDLWLETYRFLNKNNMIALFLAKDLYWHRFWLIKISWFWEQDSKGPLIKVSGFDWKYYKEERTYKLFDWERFKRKLGDFYLDPKEIMDEFLIFSGLRKRTKKLLLFLFQKTFSINNNYLIVVSEEEKKKHNNIRDFFKRNEVFGVDLLNLKPSNKIPAKNELFFRKGFDSIYSQFFENKREFLDDEKEKDLNKIIRTEEFDDFVLENHANNKIFIEENEEKTRKRSLRYFRIEKANTFYAYLKNFIKEHKFGKLYFRLEKKKRLFNVKVSFLFEDENDSVQIKFAFFDIFRRTNFYCKIVDLKDIILMTNILLVNNPIIKKSQLSRIIKQILQFNGFKFTCKNEGVSYRKMIFNEYSLKAFVMNNFLENNSNFIVNSLVFIQKLEQIGKTIVFLTIYENKQKNSLESRVFFSLNLLDFASKVRRFKLILSIEDIIVLFPQKTLIIQETIDFHNIKLLFMRLLTKFTLERVSLYSNLMFSPRKQTIKSSMISHRFEKIRKVKNCFNEKRGIPIFPKRNNGFLEEFVQESRIVIKIIKKFQGNFYCLLLSKSLLMNYWILKVYITKTSRTFVAYLNNTNLMKFSLEDLSHAFKRNMQEFIEKPSFFKNFNDFHRKIAEDVFKRNSDPIINNFIIKSKENEENLRNLQNKLKKAYIVSKFASNRMKKMQKIKGIMDLTKKLDNFSGKINEKTLLQYCEMEVWFRLFEKIEIFSDKTHKFELKHEEFSLILKEVLFSRYVKIDNTNEAFIEIFMFFLNENPSVFFTLDSINYAYSLNFNFVIKYLSLNRMNIQIDSINLRELINIYISDGFYKHPTNYMHSKLLMSDVKDLCHFLIYKIKSANFCNFLFNANEINLKKRRKMHANDNISYMRNIEKEANFGGQISHIKTIIARAKPYFLINALISENEKKIMINVYNCRRSDMFIKEVSFRNIRKKNEFFIELLKEKEWKILVERLWMMIQKEVLIEAEFNFKFNEK